VVVGGGGVAGGAVVAVVVLVDCTGSVLVVESVVLVTAANRA
jgi:hypothetical protein